MSDIESELRAVDPLHALDSTAIDFDAMKSRVTSRSFATVPTSRRRQMTALSLATVAILVTTVTLVSITSDDALHHAPPSPGRSPLRAAGSPVIYGAGAVGTSSEYGTSVNGSNFAPPTPPTNVYAAGAGLSAPATSGPVYKLNAFNDARSEAQRLAGVFGVSAPASSVPTTAFAAEYQAGDMGSSTGSMQYFIQDAHDSPFTGFGLFQYIANGEENWSFNGPITSTVDAATATRDLSAAHTLWTALDTGFTLSNPTWMRMQLTSQSNARSTSETQLNFTLSIDGHQTLQGVQFSFDDSGKVVYAEGLDLAIVSSVMFPFQSVAATIEQLNAQQYGDCSPIAIATSAGTLTLTPNSSPTTTLAPMTETLVGLSILYQIEMMSNAQPWLVPFYQFTQSDGSQSSAPFISTLGPTYFSVHNGGASSCSMTLTQP